MGLGLPAQFLGHDACMKSGLRAHSPDAAHAGHSTWLGLGLGLGLGLELGLGLGVGVANATPNPNRPRWALYRLASCRRCRQRSHLRARERRGKRRHTSARNVRT